MNGLIPPDRYFPYLTWSEIDQMSDKNNVVIIQPIGAIEQHGPHLPLIVDSAIGMGVLAKALTRLDPNIGALVLPNLYYGKSNEHIHFPGTITLSAETLIALLMEVGESVYRAGFRKLVFMNSHGGQPQVLEIVARDLHVKYEDLWIFPLFTWKVPSITKELLTDREFTQGIHAGDAETSLMLALLPDQVKMDLAITEYPTNFDEQNFPVSWTTKDLSHSGTIGDPTLATLEKGQLILNSLADSWAILIKELYEFKPLVVRNN